MEKHTHHVSVWGTAASAADVRPPARKIMWTLWDCASAGSLIMINSPQRIYTVALTDTMVSIGDLQYPLLSKFKHKRNLHNYASPPDTPHQVISVSVRHFPRNRLPRCNAVMCLNPAKWIHVQFITVTFQYLGRRFEVNYVFCSVCLMPY